MPSAPRLVDQYGQPIVRATLTSEIAGPTLTGVRSPIAGYPGDGLNPIRLANILREADEGEPLRYFELAEQIEERDLHYAGVLGTRKRSVAQLDITVEAASEDDEAVRHADMIRAWLKRDELQDELFDVLDAIGKGISLTEIIWDTSSGQWQPQRLAWRDPRWFRFARIDGATPLLRENTGDVPLPPFKFIYACIRAKSGLPVRAGLARLAAWSWMFKAFTQRDWAIFSQTYGQPIRVGKYGPGATEADKDTLFRAVANIAGDCAAIVPAGMLIEFVESKSIGASSDLYEKRADWLDRQVSKAVLGQTATTDAIAGGHAVGREHRQVQEDIERADARTVSAILNRDLVRPWIDLEYGPQKVYPKISIGRAEQTDVKLVVESVKELVPLGLKVGMATMRDMLNIPEPDENEEILGAPPEATAAPAKTPPAAGSKVPPARGEEDQPEQKSLHARPRDAVDMLAMQAEDLAAPAADQLIDRMREIVEKAQSMEELRDQLKAMAPKDMPAADLAQVMAQALAMAELLGRSEIAGGAT